MAYLPDDVRLDHPTLGSEFSTRIDRVLADNRIETVGQLRAKRDELHKWRGLGKQSLYEIKSWLRDVSRPQGDLLQDTEYARYQLEDTVGSVEALMHDVLRSLTRVALKGKVTRETRNHMALKLTDAAKYLERLPVYGEKV